MVLRWVFAGAVHGADRLGVLPRDNFLAISSRRSSSARKSLL